MADMWQLVNRELAKLERDRGGKSDTPYLDIVSEAIDLGQKQRAWKERENAQRQQIMSDLSKNTNRLYNNEDVTLHKDRLKKYYDKYKGSMDESTLELGQMMLDNYDFQMKKNDSFNAYKSRQDDEMKKVSDYINKNIEVGKEYTEKDLEEFRNVYTNYINYTEEFTNKHADRLELKANRHINQELAQSAYMNDYMLDSFFDDKKIDKVEYQAYKEASARNSIQPILDYNDYHSGLVKASSKALVGEIEKGVQEYKQMTSIINDKIPVPKEWSGNLVDDEGSFFSQLGEEQQTAIEDYHKDLEKDIKLGDKKHVERHGTSYIDDWHKGLLKTPPPPPPPPKETEGIQDFTYKANETLDKEIDIPETKLDAGQTDEIYNPGNLRFANQKDATGKDARGFAIFPSEKSGWQALYNQIELDKGRNLTLDQFVHKYAPPVENDTITYRNNLQKELKVDKNININKIDTKKLANAIARQEGYGGKFPEVLSPPTEPVAKARVKIDEPLTEVKDGKTVINYNTADTYDFKKQQTNLKKIADEKYNIKDNKKNYKNVRDFVSDKFEEWLNSVNKRGKYSKGDFIYFIPTRVDKNNKINPNEDMNLYNLYHPNAFKGVKGNVRMRIKPNIGGGYLNFAKDFDEFRKFLQES
tara:strand:- start:17178 stop:19106 length:1929 start_codon:yes stop_codon:yes gene_type:complete